METVFEELSKLEGERGWRGGRIVEELESVDGEPKLLVRDLHIAKDRVMSTSAHLMNVSCDSTRPTPTHLVMVRHFDEEAVQQSRSDC